MLRGAHLQSCARALAHGQFLLPVKPLPISLIIALSRILAIPRGTGDDTSYDQEIRSIRRLRLRLDGKRSVGANKTSPQFGYHRTGHKRLSAWNDGS